jgi:hypothetical protein
MVVVLIFKKKMGCVFGTLYKRRFGFYAVVHLSTCRSRVPMRSCGRQLDLGIMHFGPGARVGSTEPSSPYRYTPPETLRVRKQTAGAEGTKGFTISTTSFYLRAPPVHT